MPLTVLLSGPADSQENRCRAIDPWAWTCDRSYGVTVIQPDGFGGIESFGTGANGRTRPDGFGGYDTYGPDGSGSHCEPTGFGRLDCQ